MSQDVVRRDMLYVADEMNNPSIQLIYDLCMYGNHLGATVILEGILSKKKYGDMLKKLLRNFSGGTDVYYFDVPFEETLRRHAGKANAHEFGEEEMRKWWKDKDILGAESERVIGEDMTQEEIVCLIRGALA